MWQLSRRRQVGPYRQLSVRRDLESEEEMTPAVYLLPGRGARLDSGLGAEITRRGYALSGQEITPTFEQQPFSDQIQQVRGAIVSEHFHDSGLIVAHSYGAHLCLSALADLPAYPGRLLLISPVFRSVRSGFNSFRPPGAKSLAQAIDSGSFPCPTGRVSILSGELDWQVPTDGLQRLASVVRADFELVPQAEHQLPHQVVRDWLDRVLESL